MAARYITIGHDTTLERRVVSKMISILEPTEVPLLQRLGLDNNSLQLDTPIVSGRKYEWHEDTLPTDADALNGAIDATQTSIVVDDASLFQVGDVLEIESEYVNVTAVDTTADTLTVLRAWGGTTGATHADNIAVTARTIAKTSGANYALGPLTTVTNLFNYSQIIERAIESDMTVTETAKNDYGISDYEAYHLGKMIGGPSEIGAKGRAGILAIRLAKIAYYGKRQAPSGRTTAGGSGGLATLITTNLTGDTSTALTRNSIETQARTCYNAGGYPQLLVCGTAAKSRITSMFDGYIRTERSEKTGGHTITMIDTPVVEGIEVMVDRFCPTTKVYLLDESRVGYVTVRPFEMTAKPSMGDYQVKSVLGEYGFWVCNEQAHSIITHSAAA